MKLSDFRWRLAAAALLAAAVLVCAPAVLAGTSRLTIHTASGAHVFEVEEALTEAQRERGLMNRKTMAPDRGMIFRFPSSSVVSFWMKNTFIPLDMLFVRGDGTLAGIAENATPLSLDTIQSPEPVRYVVELNAGQAARIGAKEGDRLENRLIR